MNFKIVYPPITIKFYFYLIGAFIFICTYSNRIRILLRFIVELMTIYFCMVLYLNFHVKQLTNNNISN